MLLQTSEGVGLRHPKFKGSTPPLSSLDDPPEDEESSLRSELVVQPLPHTGGKGTWNWQVHVEYMVSFGAKFLQCDH
jgi:hypothetical protein